MPGHSVSKLDEICPVRRHIGRVAATRAPERAERVTPEDSQLVAQARTGDMSAFLAIYERYKRDVLKQFGVMQIVKTGECKCCGYCCPLTCPHFINENGLCADHETKNEYCSICDQTHEDCIDAPNYPMRKWNPECGYRFYVKGTDLEAISVEVTKKQ